ncbi:hypothetical protein AB3X89_06810 [Paraburkholderia sp. BR14320]|uniref:hypothetical protein n=1 Tax=Paraburkholderia sp. BR14320 TaxID=3237006 RepID=UPI0034CF8B8E
MSKVLAFLLVIFFVVSVARNGVILGILSTVSGVMLLMLAYYVWFVHPSGLPL